MLHFHHFKQDYMSALDAYSARPRILCRAKHVTQLFTLESLGWRYLKRDDSGLTRPPPALRTITFIA